MPTVSITWADVVDIDASLSAVPAARQESILLDVGLMLDPTAWGDRYDMGCKYLAAHYGVLALRSGGSAPQGPVASESLGPASRSYASSSAALGPHASTSWGQMFDTLVRTLIGARFGVA